MRRIKKYLVLVLTGLLMMTNYGQAVYAANPRQTVTGSVMVKCQGEGYFEMHITDGNIYEPNSEMIMADDTGNRFYVTFDEPGNYHYRITQVAGKDPTFFYDDHIYDVLFFVTTNSDGSLNVETMVYEHRTKTKVDEIIYRNHKKTCQESGYPEGYEWSEEQQACVYCPTCIALPGNVNTYDDNQNGLYTGILMISACVVIFTGVVLMKTRKQKEEGE